MATNINTTSIVSFLKRKLEDYKLLVKLKLTLLVVFTANIAYLLAADTWDLKDFLLLGLGGFLITGTANTLNQVLEKDYDRLMQRTANRPLADGRMEITEAVLFAGVIGAIGILLLASFNSLTAVLGSLSMISYAFIYTPMKRVSPAAVWIGAIPGALPMAIGWTAVTGELGPEALFLFSIQFFWQFPHFWAIAWVAYEDYAKAGFFLLPSQKRDGRDKSTALQTVFYAFCLIPLSFIPMFLMDDLGYITTGAMFLGGVIYLMYSVRLYQACTVQAARALMFCSFFYLPLVLIALVLDKII